MTRKLLSWLGWSKEEEKDWTNEHVFSKQPTEPIYSQTLKKYKQTHNVDQFHVPCKIFNSPKEYIDFIKQTFEGEKE